MKFGTTGQLVLTTVFLTSFPDFFRLKLTFTCIRRNSNLLFPVLISVGVRRLVLEFAILHSGSTGLGEGDFFDTDFTRPSNSIRNIDSKNQTLVQD